MAKKTVSSAPRFTLGQTAAGEPLQVDLAKLIGWRAIVTASSGGGKSWLLRLIAERTAGKVQCVILDVEGEFGTLREKHDYLLVGEGGEAAADVRSAKLLARKLAELQVSAVIDLYDVPGRGDPWEKRRLFAAEFLSALIALPKKLWHPMLVIVDEAHQFAPEDAGRRSKTDPVLDSRSAVRNLMSLGRKRGFAGILATQRVSKLDKDSMEPGRNYFIGGTTLDIDQARAGDMLGFGKADRLALRDLEPGEFYCFGPAIAGKGVQRFHSGAVATTHPSPGDRHLLTVTPAPDSIRKLVDALGDLPAQAQEEVDQLKQAQSTIVDLRRQLRERPVEIKPETVVERVEVPVLNGQLPRLEAALGRLEAIPPALAEAVQPLTLELAGVRQAIQAVAALPRTPSPRGAAPGGRSAPAPRPAPVKPAPSIESAAGVTRPQQAILDALYFLESIGVAQPSRVQAALLAGQSPKSSGYANNLGSLRSSGLLDYPAGGALALTAAGRAQARPPAEAPTVESVQAAFLARLSNPQRRIVEALIAVYPASLAREELAARAEQSATSSGFANNLGALRSLGVVDYPQGGHVAALPVLFLEGA